MVFLFWKHALHMDPWKRETRTLCVVWKGVSKGSFFKGNINEISLISKWNFIDISFEKRKRGFFHQVWGSPSILSEFLTPGVDRSLWKERDFLSPCVRESFYSIRVSLSCAKKSLSKEEDLFTTIHHPTTLNLTSSPHTKTIMALFFHL